MGKGRWKLSDEQIAIEAYAVLMMRQRPGRTYSKGDLEVALREPGIYPTFLKLCLEHDSSKDLRHFKKGLLQIVKVLGVTKISNRVGLSRLSLYRMLSKNGNPRLGSLLSLFDILGVHLWIVDEDFKNARQKVVRPKDL